MNWHTLELFTLLNNLLGICVNNNHALIIYVIIEYDCASVTTPLQPG